jgi:hypothetical protein
MRILIPWSAREQESGVDSKQAKREKGESEDARKGKLTFHAWKFFGCIYVERSRIDRLAVPNIVSKIK